MIKKNSLLFESLLCYFQNEIRKDVLFLCEAIASLEGADADTASGSLQVDFFPVSVSIILGGHESGKYGNFGKPNG